MSETTVRPHVFDVEAILRNSQTRRGDQPEHRDVEFAPQRVRPLAPQLPCAVQDARDLLRRVVSRHGLADREGVARRELMPESSAWRKRANSATVAEIALPGPLASGLPPSPRPRPTRLGCEPRRAKRIIGKRPQMTLGPTQLVVEGSTQRDVTVDSFAQQGSLPAQGCAISERSAMSTLA